MIRSLPETAAYDPGQVLAGRSVCQGRDLHAWHLGCGPLTEEAGLHPLGMIGVQPHFGPGDEVGLAFLMESMRVAEPLIVGTGVATAEEIGMETFEQRLRDEGKESTRW